MKKAAGFKEKQEKSRQPWSNFVFLAAVVALYAVSFCVQPEKTAEAYLFGVKVLAKLWPVLLFVFFLMFVVNLMVKPRWIRRHVGHDSGLKGVWVALMGGIISMGPVYIWYAMLRDFQKKGMRSALIAVFFYARGIKIPLLPLMAFYFGLTYTVVLTLYMTLFSVLNGFFIEWLVQGRKSV
jgi:uncharacterized membrane protein YraQ (UPF0718 family)